MTPKLIHANMLENEKRLLTDIGIEKFNKERKFMCCLVTVLCNKINFRKDIIYEIAVDFIHKVTKP
jgi:hypothetical protein